MTDPPSQLAAALPGFWSAAWARVLTRPSAIAAILWILFVALLGVWAPVIASGHPLLLWPMDPRGGRGPVESPLVSHLSAADLLLLVGTLAAAALFLWRSGSPRRGRWPIVVAGGAQAALIGIGAHALAAMLSLRDSPDWARALGRQAWSIPALAAGVCSLVSLPFLAAPSLSRGRPRLLFVAGVGLVSGFIVAHRWAAPPESFDYTRRESRGELNVLDTLVPWSPNQRPTDRNAAFLPPGSSGDQPLAGALVGALPDAAPLSPEQIDLVLARIDLLPLPESQRTSLHGSIEAYARASPPPDRQDLLQFASDELARGGRRHWLGTDSLGQDVLAQLLHACRMAVSIGLVSTGIGVALGVTIGALMGYFGGLVDLVLSRIVEVFMGVPLLFVLILAAGVLPRDTYVTMAVIGCFTWTGAARFTRAEFLRLRGQDFVLAARAAGLPLRSTLFRHMLPGAVTPVLVEASFAIAFAIILEATLSFLGLGPAGQPSWGRLLADATTDSGGFAWWLALPPGIAIFLTALSYNALGQSLRDAIDPATIRTR